MMGFELGPGSCWSCLSKQNPLSRLSLVCSAAQLPFDTLHSFEIASAPVCECVCVCDWLAGRAIIIFGQARARVCRRRLYLSAANEINRRPANTRPNVYCNATMTIQITPRTKLLLARLRLPKCLAACADRQRTGRRIELDSTNNNNNDAIALHFGRGRADGRRRQFDCLVGK
jgi:hypothetical protein